MKGENMTPEQFRKMQLLELGMIEELDRVCRKNNINYVIFCGTMLGAVRHKGFIPWDDDADIAMLREDYEKFKQHANELNPDICFFQDHKTDSEYLWGYGKLRRTGSVYLRTGQEHLKSKTGIFIDIFPMDDIPQNSLGQVMQDIHCYFLRKILWSEVAKVNEKGVLKIWYSLISKIPRSLVYKRLDWYTKRSRNSSPNRVRVLLFPSIGRLYKKNPFKEKYGMPKEWFLQREEYEFEGKKFYGTKDYDTELTYIYGDYMTPPPENKRKQHSPCSEIVFPNEN